MQESTVLPPDRLQHQSSVPCTKMRHLAPSLSVGASSCLCLSTCLDAFAQDMSLDRASMSCRQTVGSTQPVHEGAPCGEF